MTIKFFFISLTLLLFFHQSYAQFGVGTLNPSIQTTGGRVGIGIASPNTTLDILTPAVTTGNYTERLFSARINDASSSSDFFQITNSTVVNHSFIPTLWGHHTTDNRRAFALLV